MSHSSRMVKKLEDVIAERVATQSSERALSLLLLSDCITLLLPNWPGDALDCNDFAKLADHASELAENCSKSRKKGSFSLKEVQKRAGQLRDIFEKSDSLIDVRMFTLSLLSLEDDSLLELMEEDDISLTVGIANLVQHEEVKEYDDIIELGKGILFLFKKFKFTEIQIKKFLKNCKTDLGFGLSFFFSLRTALVTGPERKEARVNFSSIEALSIGMSLWSTYQKFVEIVENSNGDLGDGFFAALSRRRHDDGFLNLLFQRNPSTNLLPILREFMKVRALRVR